jgi:hypothetical protein
MSVRAYVCVCEWRGKFNRVVIVVQLGLICHFILNPEQRRVFQLVFYNVNHATYLILILIFTKVRFTLYHKTLMYTQVCNAL